jgi:curved DNA-binding protein CbpA
MDTLYDLLGALPHDDAESLRSAFRRAVKGAHPDIRPGDPDAALKFRQIVRANEILCDREQRAAYDHLLALARIEKDPASAHPIAAKIHKMASGVLALATASIVTTGGYFLCMHMSMALVTPVGSLAAANNPPASIDLTTRLSASIAAVSPTDAPDPAAGVEVSPGQVTQLEQKFTAPFVDRGILFFREKKDDGGFPELAPFKRSDKPAHRKALLAAAAKTHPEALPKVVPLPQPRTASRFFSWQPLYVSAGFP